MCKTLTDPQSITLLVEPTENLLQPTVPSKTDLNKTMDRMSVVPDEERTLLGLENEKILNQNTLRALVEFESKHGFFKILTKDIQEEENISAVLRILRMCSLFVGVASVSLKPEFDKIDGRIASLLFEEQIEKGHEKILWSNFIEILKSNGGSIDEGRLKSTRRGPVLEATDQRVSPFGINPEDIRFSSNIDAHTQNFYTDLLVRMKSYKNQPYVRPAYSDGYNKCTCSEGICQYPRLWAPVHSKLCLKHCKMNFINKCEAHIQKRVQLTDKLDILDFHKSRI